MKKILITIISIVLIVSVCFALAACDPKDPEPQTCTQHVDADNNGKCDNCGATVTPQAGEIVTEIPADYQDSVAKLQSQAAAWILNNADNKADHAKDLGDFINDVRKAICKSDISKSAVELKDGKYNVTLTFANGKRYIMTLDTMVNNDTYVAGKSYQATTDLTFDQVFVTYPYVSFRFDGSILPLKKACFKGLTVVFAQPYGVFPLNCRLFFSFYLKYIIKIGENQVSALISHATCSCQRKCTTIACKKRCKVVLLEHTNIFYEV